MSELKSDVPNWDRRFVLKGAVAAAVPASVIANSALAANPTLAELCRKHATLSEACFALKQRQDSSRHSYRAELIDRWERNSGERADKDTADIFLMAASLGQPELDALLDKHDVIELIKKRRELMAAHDATLELISKIRARSLKDVSQKLQAAVVAAKAGHSVDQQLAKLTLSLSEDFQEMRLS